MIKTSLPWPTKILQLQLCFDISATGHDLAGKDHQALAKAALERAGLKPDGTVIARTTILPRSSSPVSIESIMVAAQNLPKDDWNALGRKLEDGNFAAVRLEFVYSACMTYLCIRILTELPRMDGVSAVRLALHTLEALEGGVDAVGVSEKFKVNPPLVWGWRQKLNQFKTIAWSICAAKWPFTSSVSEREAQIPTSVAGLRNYFKDPTRAKEPAVFRLYRDDAPTLPTSPITPSGSALFKKFIRAVGVWHDKAGLHGHFNLNNFAGQLGPAAVSPSIVNKAEQLLSVSERYKGAFIPPGPFPFGPVWDTLNVVHTTVLFTNNYGRHTHSFQSIPKAFSWDWLGLMAPVPGCGVISINGVLLAWTRWTKAGIADSDGIFEEVLGPAIMEWKQCETMCQGE